MNYLIVHLLYEYLAYAAPGLQIQRTLLSARFTTGTNDLSLLISSIQFSVHPRSSLDLTLVLQPNTDITKRFP